MITPCAEKVPSFEEIFGYRDHCALIAIAFYPDVEGGLARIAGFNEGNVRGSRLGIK